MGEGRRRIIIIGVSSLVLVAMVAVVTIGVTNHKVESKNTHRQELSTSMKAIKNVCEPTDFKEVCVDSLSAAAGNTTDPNELVRTAFKVALKTIEEAENRSTLLQELQKDPRTKEALENCKELAKSAVYDLQRSFDQMGKLDASKFDDLLANLKIWLSGAITYQETCLDGFEDTTGDAGDKMREYLKMSMQMTSNGLAMVTEISEALSSLNLEELFSGHRRLLGHHNHNHGHDFPYWMNERARRFLAKASKGKPKGHKHTFKPDLVVAKDGSGDYVTINEALKDIPKNRSKTFVLYIKEGVYEEKVQFNKSWTHLMVVGDGPTKTKITGKHNAIDGGSTFQSATVAVLGDYFIAKDIGFENTAGPEKHQAVALRVGADMSIFYNCQIDGYQDTLYVHTYRQFYRNCVISGTIDFIFGDGAAVFQNCTLLVRKPLDNQANMVTAQGRKEKRQPSGIVLQNCTITAHPEFYPFRNSTKTYLGRPWKEYSRTIIMESYIDDLIQPEGWMPWNTTNYALDTCFYSEYNNRGPAASKIDRVQWYGIKELTKARVERFFASEFIKAEHWIAKSHVPYVPGLVFPPPPDSPLALQEEIEHKKDKERRKREKEQRERGEKISGNEEVPAPAQAPAFAPKMQAPAPAFEPKMQAPAFAPKIQAPAFSPEMQAPANAPDSSWAFSPMAATAPSPKVQKQRFFGLFS